MSTCVSVYLAASRQNVRSRQSLCRLICRLPLSRDHCDSQRLTLLQTPGQRSADKTRVTSLSVAALLCCISVLLFCPPHPVSWVRLSLAGVASPAAPCTTCPSRQDSFSAPLLSSQSQFLCRTNREILNVKKKCNLCPHVKVILKGKVKILSFTLLIFIVSVR